MQTQVTREWVTRHPARWETPSEKGRLPALV